MAGFQIGSKIDIRNPAADVDIRYGTYNSVAEAKSSVILALREKGLTVGVIDNGKVIEYWWRDGVTDNDLIPKAPEFNDSDSINAFLSEFAVDSEENLPLPIDAEQGYLYYVKDTGKLMYYNGTEWHDFLQGKVQSYVDNAVGGYEIILPSGVTWTNAPNLEVSKSDSNTVILTNENNLVLNDNGTSHTFDIATIDKEFVLSPVANLNERRFDIICAKTNEYSDPLKDPEIIVKTGSPETYPNIPAQPALETDEYAIDIRMVRKIGINLNNIDVHNIVHKIREEFNDTYEEFGINEDIIHQRLEDETNWNNENEWSPSTTDEINYDPDNLQLNDNPSGKFYVKAGQRHFSSDGNYYFVFSSDNSPVRRTMTGNRFSPTELAILKRATFSDGVLTAYDAGDSEVSMKIGREGIGQYLVDEDDGQGGTTQVPKPCLYKCVRVEPSSAEDQQSATYFKIIRMPLV